MPIKGRRGPLRNPQKGAINVEERLGSPKIDLNTVTGALQDAGQWRCRVLSGQLITLRGLTPRRFVLSRRAAAHTAP